MKNTVLNVCCLIADVAIGYFIFRNGINNLELVMILILLILLQAYLYLTNQKLDSILNFEMVRGDVEIKNYAVSLGIDVDNKDIRIIIDEIKFAEIQLLTKDSTPS